MNILGAIFPLGNFRDPNNHHDTLDGNLQRSLPFARACLLRGDADQCFRSLLFQAALSYASIDKRVAFYTPVPFQSLPSLVHNLVPSALATANLHLIQFHYLSTLADVHKHLLHLSADVIILDGYLEFPLADEDDRFRIVSACALLRDTYAHLTRARPDDDLILLCSCTCADASMADVEQRGLFDLAVDIEMLEDGDYHADVHVRSTNEISCRVNFRIGHRDILPLTATVQHRTE